MISSMVFSTHKEKWEKLAKENANYYVWSESASLSERKYRKSGNLNFKNFIAKDPLIKAMGRKKSLNFLEIGCGNGRMTEFIAKKFAQVYAVDISPEMLSQARRRLNKSANVHYVESKGSFFEIEKNSIDVAFSFIVFQHMPEEKMVEDNFSLIREALKPQGLFKVQLRGCKCKENQWFSGVDYDISKVKKLVEKTGFKLIDYKGDGQKYFWLWLEKSNKDDGGNKIIFKKVINNLHYSVRRYYVDDFFSKNIRVFNPGGLILDIGGKKKNKRGCFDIEKYPLCVKYLNSDKDTNPDYLSDAAQVPEADNIFAGVIIAEVIEHVFDPVAVLREAYRVMKPGGQMLVSAPFLFHKHDDPDDYGRYTDSWYKKVLSEIGFRDIQIEAHGRFYGVLANMIKSALSQWENSGKSRSKIRLKVYSKFVSWFIKKAMIWDQNEYCRTNCFFSGHTTGYGIVCKK